MSKDNQEKNEKHFKVSDINIGVYLPLHFFIALTPIYPVMFLLSLYLNIFNYNIQIGLIFLPLIAIGLLLLYIIGVVYLTKFILIISSWRCKPEEGDHINRDFHSKIIYHYHLRGFLKKFPLWLIIRSPFPFLLKWMFTTFGLYKIGKNVLIYDSWIGLEFLEIEDNAIIGIGTILSSHLVDGMNQLAIRKIKLGKYSQWMHDCSAGPGLEIGENTIVHTKVGVPKFGKLRENSVYVITDMDNVVYKRDLKASKELKKRLGLRK